MALVCKRCKKVQVIRIKPRTSAEWDKPKRVDFYFTTCSLQWERLGDEVPCDHSGFVGFVAKRQ